MRRVRRWTFNALTVLSLLLCAGAVALWVRTYRLTDRINWADAAGWRGVATARGCVEVSFLAVDWSAYPQEFHGLQYQRDMTREPFNWILLMGGASGDVVSSTEHVGFAWHERRNRGRGSLHGIAVIPLWSVVAVTAALPVGRGVLRLLRRRLRPRAGRCGSCGYDLTGNVSGVCPECGSAVAGPA